MSASERILRLDLMLHHVSSSLVYVVDNPLTVLIRVALSFSSEFETFTLKDHTKCPRVKEVWTLSLHSYHVFMFILKNNF